MTTKTIYKRTANVFVAYTLWSTGDLVILTTKKLLSVGAREDRMTTVVITTEVESAEDTFNRLAEEQSCTAEEFETLAEEFEVLLEDITQQITRNF